MTPLPICTLVHISDPHFGPSFVIDGERQWRDFVSRTAGLRHVTGIFPHSYQTAGALAIAVRGILRDRREKGIPAVVVHTGDLTAGGSQAEFSVGRTYMRHGHYLENGSLAGLRLETEFGQNLFDIPGNHDLWRRRSPKDHDAFTSHYGGSYPRVMPIESANGKVLLYGLDSNRSTLWDHRLANGEIPAAAMDSLCEKLREERESGAIQVVCLHHPLLLRRRGTPRMFGMEVLRLKHRHAAARELVRSGAHIVLAGHVHAQQHSHTLGLIHFIAGSACQIGARPCFWMLDLYTKHMDYVYLHIPRRGIHFVPAISRSGAARYG